MSTQQLSKSTPGAKNQYSGLGHDLCPATPSGHGHRAELWTLCKTRPNNMSRGPGSSKGYSVWIPIGWIMELQGQGPQQIAGSFRALHLEIRLFFGVNNHSQDTCTKRARLKKRQNCQRHDISEPGSQVHPHLFLYAGRLENAPKPCTYYRLLLNYRRCLRLRLLKVRKSCPPLSG